MVANFSTLPCRQILHNACAVTKNDLIDVSPDACPEIELLFNDVTVTSTRRPRAAHRQHRDVLTRDLLAESY